MIPHEKDPDFYHDETEQHIMADHIQNKGQIGPVTKGSAAGTGVAGAGAIVIVWVASLFGFEIPAEVAGAVVVIIGFIGSLVGGKVVSPEKAARFQIDRKVVD